MPFVATSLCLGGERRPAEETVRIGESRLKLKP